MKIRGGDVRQFKLGGRELMIAPDTELELTLPGFEGDFALAGNGEMVGKAKRVFAGIAGIKVICRNENKDFEYVCGVRDTMDTTAVTMTLIDGVTFAGSLAVQGEVKMGTGDGSVSFELRGERLEQI